MRIGIDTQSTMGESTGIGRYAKQLLASLRQVAPEHEYAALNWSAEVVMRTDRRLRWQQWELPRRARAAGAELLHVTGFDAPRWRPCPVVLTVHDLIGMLFPHALPPIARLYWSRWLPHTVRWADAIIANSENTRRDLVRLLHIPTERIRTIYLGVDGSFHAPTDRDTLEAVRSHYQLSQPLILYVGTLEPRKGIDTLIAAFAQLAGDLPHSLIIAGKRGWYTETLFRQAESTGLGERVRFLDYVAAEHLPALYGLANLFVFPSRYEGFGLPVLEAMACGTPVVCSNASSLPEVAGEAALLVPPDDVDALAEAMARALRDAALRQRLVSLGFGQARRFTWSEAAYQTAALYEQIRQAGAGRK